MTIFSAAEEEYPFDFFTIQEIPIFGNNR